MTGRISCILLVQLTIGFLNQSEACTNITGDQITGRDLAAAVPQLAGIPPDLKMGYAPVPGIERVFLPSQLEQIALRFGIQTKVDERICFAWPLHLLSKEEITAAMQTSLSGRQVDLEIVDQSHVPAPGGAVYFPLQGLSSVSSAASVWNGFVLYAGNRKFDTWARVRVTLHEQQVVAARPILAGEMITLSQLRKVDYKGPLRRSAGVQTESEAAGKCARWAITSGTVLEEQMLSSPRDVMKDQLVTVHVQCGAAHIETQGIAADAGYRGEVIRVRNPKTGRMFRAKIDDQGTVTVVVGGDVGLVVENKKT